MNTCHICPSIPYALGRNDIHMSNRAAGRLFSRGKIPTVLCIEIRKTNQANVKGCSQTSNEKYVHLVYAKRATLAKAHQHRKRLHPGHVLLGREGRHVPIQDGGLHLVPQAQGRVHGPPHGQMAPHKLHQGPPDHEGKYLKERESDPNVGVWANLHCVNLFLSAKKNQATCSTVATFCLKRTKMLALLHIDLFFPQTKPKGLQHRDAV